MAINGSYVVRETTSNLTRNLTLTLASVLTVFVSLAIVGTTVLVRQGAQNMTSRWEGGIEFIVYLDADISEDELAAVQTNLDENPLVARSEYIDSDATWAEFQRLFEGQRTMLENVRPEDLPTSFKVEPVDKDPGAVVDLVNHYRNNVPGVYDVQSADEVIRQMKGMANFVNNGLTVFAAFLLVASVLLILNTIRTAMFARRREIEVMKLVGATNWFIRVPFMLEGLIQGLIGGVLAIGFVFLARGWLDDLLNRSDRISLLDSFSITNSDVVLACIIVMVTALLLSVISSVLATRRFLDV